MFALRRITLFEKYHAGFRGLSPSSRQTILPQDVCSGSVPLVSVRILQTAPPPGLLQERYTLNYLTLLKSMWPHLWSLACGLCQVFPPVLEIVILVVQLS